MMNNFTCPKCGNLLDIEDDDLMFWWCNCCMHLYDRDEVESDEYSCEDFNGEEG